MPAMVVTPEVARSMTLSTALPASAQYILPRPSRAMNLGVLNLALVPIALSVWPQEKAMPAKVLTEAVARMILRMTQSPSVT
jgi:hypothetical protein